LLDPDRDRFLTQWARPRNSIVSYLRYWLGIDPVGPPEFTYFLTGLPPIPPPDEAKVELEELREHSAPTLERVRKEPSVTAAADRAFAPLFGLMLAYACVYMPTIPLSNVVAFRNLPDPGRQYGPFRALGTVGWIAAGLLVGFAAPAVSPLCFLYAAVTSAVLGVLCFLLPRTPPVEFAPRDSRGAKWVADALGLRALKMLTDRSFLAYLLAALAATSLMPFHNSFANKFLVDLHVEHAAAVQTLAQPTEILGAILLPWVWARIGIKRMLCLGLLASAARFFMYATESKAVVIGVGFPLHGIGFALFYIAAALYVDRQAPPDLRASAQGLVTVVTLGFGGVVGNWFAGRVVEWNTVSGTVDWRAVFLVPAFGTLAAAGALAIFFRERVGSPSPSRPPSPIKGEGGEKPDAAAAGQSTGNSAGSRTSARSSSISLPRSDG
jgi:nucleoside transporter